MKVTAINICFGYTSTGITLHLLLNHADCNAMCIPAAYLRDKMINIIMLKIIASLHNKIIYANICRFCLLPLYLAGKLFLNLLFYDYEKMFFRTGPFYVYCNGGFLTKFYAWRRP